MQEYHMHNAFGALTSLASLQAIAAMQGAANLSSAGGIAALGSNLDFMNSMNKQANLGGLGGLGINSKRCGHSVYTHLLPTSLHNCWLHGSVGVSA